MPRRLLTIMTAATIAIATGIAAAQPPEPETAAAPDVSVLSGATVSCTAAWPTGTTGCWVEKRILTLGDFEVALALDSAVTISTGAWYLTPMLSVSYYGPELTAWVEVTLPAGTIPGLPLGRGDWGRIGVSYRIP